MHPRHKGQWGNNALHQLGLKINIMNINIKMIYNICIFRSTAVAENVNDFFFF